MQSQLAPVGQGEALESDVVDHTKASFSCCCRTRDASLTAVQQSCGEMREKSLISDFRKYRVSESLLGSRELFTILF